MALEIVGENSDDPARGRRSGVAGRILAYLAGLLRERGIDVAPGVLQALPREVELARDPGADRARRAAAHSAANDPFKNAPRLASRHAADPPDAESTRRVAAQCAGPGSCRCPACPCSSWSSATAGRSAFAGSRLEQRALAFVARHRGGALELVPSLREPP